MVGSIITAGETGGIEGSGNLPNQHNVIKSGQKENSETCMVPDSSSFHYDSGLPFMFEKLVNKSEGQVQRQGFITGSQMWQNDTETPSLAELEIFLPCLAIANQQ